MRILLVPALNKESSVHLSEPPAVLKILPIASLTTLHGCQRLFMSGFRFWSSLWGPVRGFGLRPTPKHPSPHARKKNLWYSGQHKLKTSLFQTRPSEEDYVSNIFYWGLWWEIIRSSKKLTDNVDSTEQREQLLPLISIDRSTKWISINSELHVFIDCSRHVVIAEETPS